MRQHLSLVTAVIAIAACNKPAGNAQAATAAATPTPQANVSPDGAPAPVSYAAFQEDCARLTVGELSAKYGNSPMWYSNDEVRLKNESGWVVVHGERTGRRLTPVIVPDDTVRRFVFFTVKAEPGRQGDMKAKALWCKGWTGAASTTRLSTDYSPRVGNI